ncbi:unnamed protein product [Protopolystoma xenopodis]|uniref:Secreted protein n=1 Tax=Protopolystoma xenopodis TaxID=117903 RepID=A0A3S5BEW8_9PLAT|nr:unnamed protein product [Protopolystoma xenopodis]
MIRLLLAALAHPSLARLVCETALGWLVRCTRVIISLLDTDQSQVGEVYSRTRLLGQSEFVCNSYTNLLKSCFLKVACANIETWFHENFVHIL